MSENFSIPTTGDVVAGKYLVKEELGRGAYGVVFRAVQQGLGRDVALKTLLPQAFLQADIVERFQREAQLIALLAHQNVIQLIDYGKTDGLLYMAVEYVQGRSLADLIKNEAPVDLEKARELVLQILDALEYAHARGIVHRDLKPDNILLLRMAPEEGGPEEVVKILDFGIAKLVRGENVQNQLKTLTQDGTVLGTPHYMSPENIVGDAIDHRTDLYAVGVIMYEMLVGKHPFDAPSPSAVMVRHLRDDAPHLPAPLTGSAFDVAIQMCLQKQPEDRVESATKLKEILHTPPEHLPALPPPSAPVETSALSNFVPAAQTPAEAKAQSVRWGVAFALMGLILASLVWIMFAPDDNPVTVVVTPPQTASQTNAAVVASTQTVAPAGEPDGGEDDAGFEFDEGVEIGDPVESVATPTKPKEPKKKPEDAPSEKAATVTFTVNSTPTDATVTIDGVLVGNTPVKRKVPSSDKVVRVRVSHVGYKHEVFELAADRDQEVNARLEYERIKMF